MKAFVTYLKKESPAMQLASGSTGWLELPNGQRWNPATSTNSMPARLVVHGGFVCSGLSGALWPLAKSNRKLA